MKLDEIGVASKKLGLLDKIRAIFNISDPRNDLRFIWLGASVGFIAAFFAIVFREAIDGITTLFFGDTGGGTYAELFASISIWKIIFIPPAVGAAVTVFTSRYAPEARGHGVPEIMDALVTKRGVIRPRVTLVKLLASAFSISGGFSVGREGPTALIGASIGSFFGQVLRFRVDKMKMIVGCGTAAGIAATFNTPLAGAAFALELVVGHFNVRYLTTIFISAMVATVVTHNYYGDVHELFSTIRFELNHGSEIFSYAVLGVLMGVCGILYTKILYGLEHVVDKWSLPEWVKGALGGMGISVMLFTMPELSGPATWESIHSTLSGQGGLDVAFFFFGLAVAKVMATSFSLAMGGSGGIFAPSLLIGGALGASYGIMLAHYFPDFIHRPSGYALVGMGALVASVTQAPLTAIAIIFEMTHNMTIMLPLIVSGSLALGIYNHFMEGSIYTLKLKKRGLSIEWGRETGVLENVLVGKVMAKEEESVAASINLTEALRIFAGSTRSTLPVVDIKGELLGILSLWDINNFISENPHDLEETSVSKVLTKAVSCVHPMHNLYEAFMIISGGDYDYLPVVASPDSKRLVGRLSRAKVLQVYKSQLITRGISDQLEE